MNIIFIASEVHPFIKTGGLGDVCGALPLALEKIGMNVSVFLPKYGSIKLSSFERVDQNCVKTVIGRNVSVYFIEHQDYFENRSGVYGEHDRDYPDNLERFKFFCLETLRVISALNLPVDILHCHDWQAALVPVYFKEMSQPHLKAGKVKTIMTIHNMAFQGVFPAEKYGTLSLPAQHFGVKGFEFYGQINLLKAGLIWSDHVTTVSPRYAKEIQTKEFGCGLEGILKDRPQPVSGILNGLDYDYWNPRADELIAQKLQDSPEEFKAANKAHLQKQMHFDLSVGTIVFGFVARLSNQKGVDMILNELDVLMRENVQIVIQGTGSPDYHRRLMEKVAQYPRKLAVCLRFDEPLAHQIFAGSDFFLMPSSFEPCGLGQMIALRYGTIPIVYRTGGLADTVTSFKDDPRKANGFVFDRYQAEDFHAAIHEAQKTFRNPQLMGPLVQRAMDMDYSWAHSAQDYQRMYAWLLSV